jgi:serine/threonine-protein kinase HipA
VKRLLVRLSATPVGHLDRVSGDTWEFRFLPEYVNLAERPVLGQAFEDDLTRSYRATLRLPAFFSNLLPEGALRQLLARKAAVNEQREALLLAALGDDLPGSILVHAEGERGAPEEEPDSPAPPEGADSPLKFSLAGVQLKLSVIRQEGKLVVPVSGRGGRWIAKFPDRDYPRVPENEHTMLLWARRAGIEVPDFELVEAADVEGLPTEFSPSEPWVLAIRRYDRGPAEERIHQEDFAQVLGIYPHEKYDKHNYETIARIALAVAGPEALPELVRRLVFMVLSGNGDAHHKNWSLLYPDGRRACLAPAYDLVFTRAYIENDRLALNFAGAKDFSLVSREAFRRFARKAHLDEDEVTALAEQSADAIRTAWKEIAGDARLSAEARDRLERHLDAVPL